MIEPANLIDVQGMIARYGVSRARVYQWLAIDTFPPAVCMPGVSVRVWDVEQVDAWRASRSTAHPR